MKILSLDSSALVASVALCENEKVLAEYTINNGNTHSETLLPMIESMLSFFDLSAKDIDLFAEQLHCIVAADMANKDGSPHIAHGIQDVSLQCALGISQQHDQTFTTAGHYSLGNNCEQIKVGFSGSRSTGLYIPAVVTVSQELFLFNR